MGKVIKACAPDGFVVDGKVSMMTGTFVISEDLSTEQLVCINDGIPLSQERLSEFDGELFPCTLTGIMLCMQTAYEDGLDPVQVMLTDCGKWPVLDGRDGIRVLDFHPGNLVRVSGPPQRGGAGSKYDSATTHGQAQQVNHRYTVMYRIFGNSRITNGVVMGICNSVEQVFKYIVIERDPVNGRVYEAYFHSDLELAEHIKGTFEHSDHAILSVTNINPG